MFTSLLRLTGQDDEREFILITAAPYILKKLAEYRDSQTKEEVAPAIPTARMAAAYNQGHNDFNNGEPIDSNSYRSDSIEYNEWDRGYLAAKDEEEK